MRLALALALVSSLFLHSEASAARKRPKHHAAAKVKAASKTPKRSPKAKQKSKEIAQNDETAEADETPPMPKVTAAAPMSRESVAQATDDEEPPAKKR
jgi:hypothetical protein